MNYRICLNLPIASIGPSSSGKDDSLLEVILVAPLFDLCANCSVEPQCAIAQWSFLGGCVWLETCGVIRGNFIAWQCLPE